MDHLIFRALIALCKPLGHKRGLAVMCRLSLRLIKSAKKKEKMRKTINVVEVAYISPQGSVSVLYSNLSLILEKIIS